jgi:hypothetical protein
VAFIADVYHKTPPTLFSPWALRSVNKFRDPGQAGIYAITAAFCGYKAADALTTPLARNAIFATTRRVLMNLFSYQDNLFRISDPRTLTPMTILIHLLHKDEGIAAAVMKNMRMMQCDIIRSYVVAVAEMWEQILNRPSILNSIMFRELISAGDEHRRYRGNEKSVPVSTRLMVGSVAIIQSSGGLRFAVTCQTSTAAW